MTKSLSPKPSVKFLKLEAKSILKAHRKKEASCCEVFRRLHQFKDQNDQVILDAEISLQEVQFALAMEYGFKNWKELKNQVEVSERKVVRYENQSMPPLNTTLMSVIKGTAEYFDNPISVPMLYGLSGHAFVINISKNICPSSPYAWDHSTFFHLVENLGIKTDYLGFFTDEGSLEERSKAEKDLKQAIDSQTPCSFCNMEHQLIYSYDDEGFLLLKPWPGCEISEDITPGRITFSSWKEFKEVHACFFVHKQTQPVNETKAIIESLSYAVDLFTKQQKSENDNYALGSEAYTNWINGAEEFGSEHGNWWNSMVWSECRKMASEFFKEIGEKYSEHSALCSKLENVYADISQKLYAVGNKEFDSKQKISLLEEAQQKETAAIELVRKLHGSLVQVIK
ncbi:MAG: hypothetical protein GY750_20495 [Lentisphaerae bacterium]|nr:hypothetical protein [Lentisphaerota bacterium]MCP4103773.1 hypothetical protein [Lentisphaerota bacterium]